MLNRLPPISALRAFDVAARELSFTKAAELLHITQSAVSHQIRHVESLWGMQLFERRNRQVMLTREGEALIPVIREPLSSVPGLIPIVIQASLFQRGGRSIDMEITGPDLHRLVAIGGQVFGVERVWPAETFEQKLGSPLTISPGLRNLALKCGRAFGIEAFGLDVIFSGGEPYVVDVNSFPGFKGVPNAALRLADFIYTHAQELAQLPAEPRSAAE